MLTPAERQLSEDWEHPYLVQTALSAPFCKKPYFPAATCYRAADWVQMSQTQSGGKLDTHQEYFKPMKNIFVTPLCGDWKTMLNR